MCNAQRPSAAASAAAAAPAPAPAPAVAAAEDAGITLATIRGRWQKDGNVFEFKHNEVRFNGRRVNDEWNLQETVDGRIFSARQLKEGWTFSMQTSTLSHIVWQQPGKDDLVWTRPAENNAEAEEEWCVICLDPYGAPDTCMTLPCCHRLHIACGARWVSKHGTCPTCRHPTDQGIPGRSKF